MISRGHTHIFKTKMGHQSNSIMAKDEGARKRKKRDLFNDLAQKLLFYSYIEPD
jgi:hypothetical protein